MIKFLNKSSVDQPEMYGTILHTDYNTGTYYVDAYYADGSEYGRVWINMEWVFN